VAVGPAAEGRVASGIVDPQVVRVVPTNSASRKSAGMMTLAFEIRRFCCDRFLGLMLAVSTWRGIGAVLLAG
jgi:hypothetical protein